MTKPARPTGVRSQRIQTITRVHENSVQRRFFLINRSEPSRRSNFMDTHSHSRVGPLRRTFGFLFIAAAVAAVLGAVASLRAVSQPRSPEQAAALRKIAPWVTQHTAGGKQAEFMVVLTDQASL